MAVISINIGNADVARVLTAVTKTYGYQPQIQNPNYDSEQPEGSGNPLIIDNPQTSGQFANEVIRNHLKAIVRKYESQVAQQAAIDALNNVVDITEA